MGTSRSTPIEIDRASLLELARGGNLYADRFACVRELLQNAADATLVRLFVERGVAAFPTHERCVSDLRGALTSQPIDVRVEPVGTDVTTGAIRIRVRDHGTGISRADLEFLGKLGASWRNPRRRAAVEAMPEWMRPSGTFGVGIHSVFLVADEVRLHTTHFESGESLAIRIYRAGDGVSLEVADAEPLADGAGTEAVLDVPREVRGAHSRAMAQDPTVRAAFAVDPLFDAPPDSHLLAARALVRAAAPGSIVPVHLDGAPLARAFDDRTTIYDEASGLEITWVDDPKWVGGWRPPWRPAAGVAFYRGAPIGYAGSQLVPIRMNAHFSTARTMLSLSRDQLSTEGLERLRAAERLALARIGPRWLDTSEPQAAPATLRPWIARALWLRGSSAHSDWEGAVVTRASDGEGVRLGEIARAEVVRVTEGLADERGQCRVSFGEPAREIFLAESRTAEPDLFRAFGPPRLEAYALRQGSALGRSFPTIEYTVAFERGRLGVTDGAFRALLAAPPSGAPYVRRVLPCHDDYVALGLDGETAMRAMAGPRALPRDPDDPRRGDPTLELIEPYTLREGVLSVPQVERWVRFVAEHAAAGPRDVRATADLAWRFLVDFDADVRRTPEVTIAYDLDALRAELEAAFAMELPSVAQVRASLAAARGTVART